MADMLMKSKKIIGKEVHLGRMIGSGANGEVYLGEPIKSFCHTPHFPFPPKFVVKVIRRELCTASYVETIHRELNAIKSLNHPFIVGYIGSWVEMSKGPFTGCYCLAMHYCDGGDLFSQILQFASKRLHPPTELVVKMMVHVFAALNYSHSQKVIHRDIKPANVFLTRELDGVGVGKAMVGDYGLARPLDQTMQLVTTRVGTPCYCSPEIVAGESYSAKTDVFSAGSMFFEFMALERPFWKKHYTDLQSFHDIVHLDPTPRLRTIAEGRYDPGLVHVVSACLAKHEKNRPTAYDVLCSFTSRLTNFVRENRIPLYGEKGERVLERSPSPKAVAVPARRGEGKSPGRGSPVRSPMRLSPKKAAILKATAEKLKQQPHLPEVAPPGARNTPPGSPVREREATTASSLTPLMDCIAKSYGAARDTELRKLLGDDDELFIILKVISASRKADPASAENSMFKVLLSLRPTLPAASVLDLMRELSHQG